MKMILGLNRYKPKTVSCYENTTTPYMKEVLLELESGGGNIIPNEAMERSGMKKKMMRSKLISITGESPAHQQRSDSTTRRADDAQAHGCVKSNVKEYYGISVR
jgi:hypothetical protein